MFVGDLRLSMTPKVVLLQFPDLMRCTSKRPGRNAGQSEVQESAEYWIIETNPPDPFQIPGYVSVRDRPSD